MFTKVSNHTNVEMIRSGLRLPPTFAVTDYFAQGMTVDDDRDYYIGMMPPDNNRMQRESGYVMLTRFRRIDQVRLVDKLFNDCELPILRRTAVFQFHKDLLTRNAVDSMHRAAEYRRLRILDETSSRRSGPTDNN
jgi:hypothetical protein